MRNHMRYYCFCCFIALLSFSSCQKEPEQPASYTCTVQAGTELVAQSYQDIVTKLPADVIRALRPQPTTQGALGRNQSGYFHVRFQLDQTRLMDYALRFEDITTLEHYVTCLEYAFAHQLSTGDFSVVPPAALTNDPNYTPPTAGDLASGVAFFAYSVGWSLSNLKASAWYQTDPTLAGVRQRIQVLRPKLVQMLQYLLASRAVLEQVDATAPNRLLFDAVGYYSLGKYLEDTVAVATGLEFARAAIVQRDEERGYFVEAGGWDSSYNGVSVMVGLELYFLLHNQGDLPQLPELPHILSCAAQWQRSRVLSSGEISTLGNTRVYHGGEAFIGVAKEVDVVKTIKSFLYLHQLSNDVDYKTTYERIIDFYS